MSMYYRGHRKHFQRKRPVLTNRRDDWAKHMQTDELDVLFLFYSQLAAAQVFPLKHLK